MNYASCRVLIALMWADYVDVKSSLEACMKRLKLRKLLFACLLGTFSSLSLATPIATVTGGSATHNPSGTSTYGWAFDVNTAITVDSLGIWDEGGDGFAEAHDIGLWDGAGNLLTSTTIPAGTGSVLNSGFRYFDIIDLVLGVGTGYIIGATNFDVDRLLVNTSSVTTDPSITFHGNRFIDGGGVLTRPTNTFSSNSYFGPNFTITSVPEPSMLVLLALGVLGLVSNRRKRIC